MGNNVEIADRSTKNLSIMNNRLCLSILFGSLMIAVAIVVS